MKKYYNIQYLRVLACLGVITVHLGQRLGLDGGTLYLFTHFGLMGAYVFFIISGFLGFYTYNGEGKSLKAYWIQRLFRILPIYYFIILYNFILHTFILQDIPADVFGLGWLRYIFCISQMMPGEEFWRNLSMTWTISIFVLFYLLMPLLRKLIRSLRGAFVGLLLFYGLSQIIGSSSEWFTPFFYLYFFLFGVVAYFAIQERKENITGLIMLMVLIVQLILGKINSTTYACIFTVIIMITQDMQIKNRIVSTIMTTLDKYSFTIYLVQAIVMEGISMVLAVITLSPAVIILSSVIGIALISFLVYHLVDLPVQKLFQAKIKPSLNK